MSKIIKTGRKTTQDLYEIAEQSKLVCLTAYTAPIASILDKHADLLLVGDTLGMVVHGLPSTVGVTLDMMLLHGETVVRSTEEAFVVVDLPFGVYEKSKEQAFESASEIMKRTGCSAVKIEAFPDCHITAKYLVDRGIPVVGHIGIRPQAINVSGGFKVQGKTQTEAARLVNDAKLLEQAGCFAIVVEGVPFNVADVINKELKCLTIGIGASISCDGQILVTDDMLGLFDWVPKFAMKYADLNSIIDKAASDYARDVREGSFPNKDNYYKAAQ